MKLLFVLLSLTFAAQSFAYNVARRQDGLGYYVICNNGNSGGNFKTAQEACDAGTRLCDGRGGITSTPSQPRTAISDFGVSSTLRTSGVSSF
jgi:hypothetical protein